MHQFSTQFDARGCRISGATASALETYERGLGTFLSWRSGADAQIATLRQETPDFVMAHVVQAYLLIGSRDPRRVQSARPVLERAAGLPANGRERMHLAAIAAALSDDYELATARLGELLRLEPRDVLALQVAHGFDYLSGAGEHMRYRVAAVLPAWSSHLPGYHAILSMHAFGLVESGEYDRAEQAAREALALNPLDARAHHVMAHVFEMTARADAGERWMNSHVDSWGTDTVVARHCWWHRALYLLTQGQADRALTLYDQRLRTGNSGEIGDLIDASALLWRLQLHGVEIGSRWAELADAWARHIDDAFCSFNDLHAMLAFVGAQDWHRVHRLELVLAKSQSLPTRYGTATREIGLPACRGLIAFGRGNNNLAITLLSSLPELAHRLGGSHAQRDVLYLTLLHAIEHIRRPARRLHISSFQPLEIAVAG
jgi:tetratricopeptide (TPR) repeat protein